ncbi:hypothetical protein ONZ45_g15111 [Pleurotus djamor]|nr:hypothetical protein ONZ45_g15111 [Pleurotus djamor]
MLQSQPMQDMFLLGQVEHGVYTNDCPPGVPAEEFTADYGVKEEHMAGANHVDDKDKLNEYYVEGLGEYWVQYWPG